jgi:hypothetical protein
MSKGICCPKCQGTNIRSIDNQPLYHPKRVEATILNVPSFDNEIYVEFICHDCNPNDMGADTFTKVFSLVPKD